MMYMHPSIPFANDGHCDPWYIFGLFYTFPSALHWWSGAYQVSRLTEILPGYIFTRLFPGVGADYVLFLFNLGISVVAFYGAVRRLLTIQVAVMSSLFLALSPLMLGNYSATLDAPAVTWDIVNLYLVAAAMTCPDSRRRYALVFASGIALGLALNAYVAIGIFAAGNYVIYSVYVLADGSQTTRRRAYAILVSLLFTAGGALATMLLLGFLVLGFHGTFDEAFTQFNLFLSIIFNFGKSGSGGATYWQSNWYAVGGVTGMLALTGATSILNLIRLRTGDLEKNPDYRKKLLAISSGALFVVAALLVANIAGFVLLQYDYYYVFFVPYLALAIFSPLLFLGPISDILLTILVTIFCAAGFVANSLPFAKLPSVYGGSAQSQASIMTALLVAALFAAVALHKRGLALVLILILGSSAILVDRPVQMGTEMWSGSRTDEQLAAGSYARVRQGLTYLHSLRLTAAPSVFWLEPDPSFGTELVAYPRSYLQCDFWSFPAHPTNSPPLKAGEEIVVVASLDHLEQRASEALANLNARDQPISKYEINFGGVQYEILVLRITGFIRSVGNSASNGFAEVPLPRKLSCSGQLSEGRGVLASHYN